MATTCELFKTLNLLPMKKLSLVILFLTSLVGFSQNSAKAKGLLDEVSNKVASYDNISLTFDYILDNDKENIHQKTSGNVLIKKDKYHLDFMGIERIFDTKNIYTIVHDDEEVVITDAANTDDSEFTPSKILTFYQKGYNFLWDKQQKINGKNIQFIKLLPINTNDENHHIMLGIDTKTKDIQQVVYTNKNNTNTTFKISSFKTNSNIPKNSFSFDEGTYKNKGYMITKL